MTFARADRERTGRPSTLRVRASRGGSEVAWLAVGLALVLLGATLGCRKSGGGAPGEATAPSKVTLALNWVPEPEFGGFYAAREAGDYKKQGLEVEILGGGAGSPVLQMVATG